MTIEQAIKTLDAVIPPHTHMTVDREHMPIVLAWETVKEVLKRQADVQDRLLKIGTEVGQQQVFDALALALRDPAVMGAKGVLGPAKVKTVCQRVQEIVHEFADAWSPGPEQDYQQDRLDRALKDVFGGDLQPFAVRYPFMKEQKYRR